MYNLESFQRNVVVDCITSEEQKIEEAWIGGVLRKVEIPVSLWAYSVVVSLSLFHRSGRGFNPDQAVKFEITNLYIEVQY